MENWGAAELRALFGGSADVAERQIMAGGQKLDVLFLDGLTSGGDIAEQVLRPLMQTVQPGSMQAVLAQAEQARVYCAVAERVTAPEDAADKLLHGYCAVVFSGTGAALCFETKTDTRRGPSAPESENTVKGAKDAFTETMRINTSLLRRHLRSAQLRFVQKTVGLRSQTAVTVCFLADLTDPALVRRMEQRLAAIDIDGMLTPASVEEYVTGSRKTAFPAPAVHRTAGYLLSGAFERAGGPACRRAAAGVSRAGGSRHSDEIDGGPCGRLYLRYLPAGAAVSGAAGGAAAAGAVCGDGDVPSGDDPDQAPARHHRFQAGGAVRHRL